MFIRVSLAVVMVLGFGANVHAQSSGPTPPTGSCSSSNAGALYTDTGTSPATVYTCSYYNLSWQWIVNPIYGGIVYYPTVPSTCSGSLPVFVGNWPNTQMYLCVNGYPQAVGGGGGSTVNINGSQVANPNFNGSTPTAQPGYTNGSFQVTGANVSVEVPTPITTVACLGVNDTTAIQTALTSAGHIQIKGNCLINAHLIYYSNTWLDMGESSITYNPTTADYILVNQANYESPAQTYSTCVATAGSTTLTCSGAAFSIASDLNQSIDCLTAGGYGNSWDLHTSIAGVTNATTLTLSDPPGATVNPATCSVYTRDSNILITGGNLIMGGSIVPDSSLDLLKAKTINNFYITGTNFSEPGNAGAFQLYILDATGVTESNVTFSSNNTQQDGTDMVGPIRNANIFNIQGHTGDDTVDIAVNDGGYGLNDGTVYGTIDGVVINGVCCGSAQSDAGVKLLSGPGGNTTAVAISNVHGGPNTYTSAGYFPGYGFGVILYSVGNSSPLIGTNGTYGNITVNGVSGIMRARDIWLDSATTVGYFSASNLSAEGTAVSPFPLVQVSNTAQTVVNLAIDMPWTTLPSPQILLLTDTGTTTTNLYTNNTTTALFSIATGTVTNKFITPQVTGAVTIGDCAKFATATGQIVDSGGTCGGGGGTGTVTSVSVTPSNGISATVTNPTTTPAIALGLGAISPTSVAVDQGTTVSTISAGDITNIVPTTTNYGLTSYCNRGSNGGTDFSVIKVQNQYGVGFQAFCSGSVSGDFAQFQGLQSYGASIGLNVPLGTPTLAAATGITSIVAASGYPAPNNTRGTLTVTGSGTATTGTVATITFTSSEGTAPDCSATQAGGTTFFGIGAGAATNTAFTITAGVAPVSATFNLHYECKP